MNRVRIIVANETNKPITVNLMNALDPAVPPGVSVEIMDCSVTYEQFIEYIRLCPVVIQFVRSTNNRQLFFNYTDRYGGAGGLEPQLTIEGKPRPIKWMRQLEDGHAFDISEFATKWNPKKWNIADTHEKLIWEFGFHVELNLKKLQTFEIDFNIISLPVIESITNEIVKGEERGV